MTELIKINHLVAETDSDILFQGDNLAVRAKDVIGIVGRNGAGKTTLLNILKSTQSNQSNQRIVWRLAEDDISLIEQEVESFQFEETNFSNQLRKWQKKQAFETLSGGEKLKQRLFQGIAKNKPLLMLDEPTNHLDEEGVDELVDILKKYHGAVVIVSHNRYFLDQVATKIWAIEEQKITSYEGSYSHYREVRDHQRRTQQKNYEKQQKEIKRVKQEMKRFEDTSASAHAQSTKQEGAKEYYRLAAKRMDKQRKSAEKRLLKNLDAYGVEKVEKDVQIAIDLQTDVPRKGAVFIASDLTKKFGSKTLFTGGEFTIQSKEKVAISGKNGSGKTTLLNILLGEEKFEGNLWRSSSNKIGYLSQQVFDLPLKQTVAEFLAINDEQKSIVMTMFIQLGFQASQWYQQIEGLSMGERTKLKLLGHILSEKNLLILDEPTNHLDIPTREELEEVLSQYQGTVIFVSHDKYFREKIMSREIVIENEKIITKSEKAAPKKESDLTKLNFMKDRLMSELSTQIPGSKEYLKTEQEFNKVVTELKNID
ncbi:ribosomal protection-like ABC-F family protein [Vagococcus elongatus]|uniref:ABC transporter domain-containing protein n=1 Tax=Vagococcus elongatus TaxID=180344 RepID=A0A430B012_9ENTE|nr:ABC-F family ATP-binding cassette domain-containing protein [Vagococcus elongatus]RSU13582.1 hypothetical protein CBF29_04835 [Vagococcus elongatus]